MSGERIRVGVGRSRAAATVLVAIVGIVGVSDRAVAHDPDPAPILFAGGVAKPWQISADRVEHLTDYTVLDTGNSAVATISPTGSFSAHDGLFTITPVAAGQTTFIVRWVFDVNDPNAQRDEVLTVTVQPTPAAIQADFSFTPRKPGCQQEVTFDASGSFPPPGGSIVSYEWTFGDGTTATTAEPTVTHSFAFGFSGFFPVTLVVLGDGGETSSTTQSIVTDLFFAGADPVSNPGGPYVVAPGAPLQLDGSGSSDPDEACGDAISVFQWNIGGNVITEGDPFLDLTPSFLATLPEGTPVSVSLAVFDIFGFPASATTTLTVGSAPDPQEITVFPLSVNLGSVPVGETGSSSLSIENTGGVDLQITRIGIAAGADTFSTTVTNTLPFVIESGESESIGVTAAPSGPGGRTGILEIESDDPVQGLVTVFLSVAGTTGTLVFDPPVVDVGAIPVSTATSTVPFFTNTGGGDFDIDSATFVDGTQGFSLEGVTFPLTVESGTETPVTIRFEPPGVGAFSDTLRIVSTASNGTVDVAVTGTGEEAPPDPQEITVFPLSVNIGSVPVGETGSSSLSIENTGGVDLAISRIGIASGGDTFGVVVTNTLPFVIETGESESITVTAAPSGPGGRTGILEIESDDPLQGLVTVSLSVTGTTGTLVFDPPVVDVGAIPISTATSTPVAFINTGGGDFDIDSATFVDGTKGFTLEGATFPLTIESGTETPVTIRFEPPGVGAFSDTLRIVSTATNGTLDVAVTGAGEEAPPDPQEITVFPLSVNIGSVPVGETSSSSLSIENTGGVDLQISRIGIAAGADTFSTAVTNTLPFVIESGESESITVTAAPSGPGGRTGILEIESDDPLQGLVTVSLSVTGTTGTLVFDPPVVDVGAIPISTATSTPVAFINTGGGDFDIDSATFVDGTQGFTLEGATFPLTIASGTETPVTIRFEPPGAGVFSDTLRILSTATNGTLDVPVSGAGEEATGVGTLVFDPPVVDVGTIAYTTATSTPVAFINTGGGDFDIDSATFVDGTQGFTLEGATFPLTIASGTETAVTIRFEPPGAGVFSDTLRILSTATNGTLDVPVSGVGRDCVALDFLSSRWSGSLPTAEGEIQVVVRLREDKSSRGAGIGLGLDTGGGSFATDSFFDIWFEVDLDSDPRVPLTTPNVLRLEGLDPLLFGSRPVATRFSLVDSPLEGIDLTTVDSPDSPVAILHDASLLLPPTETAADPTSPTTFPAPGIIDGTARLRFDLRVVDDEVIPVDLEGPFVLRLDPAALGDGGSREVPVEIVELSLESAAPIAVGGPAVRVRLEDGPTRGGSDGVLRQSPEGLAAGVDLAPDAPALVEIGVRFDLVLDGHTLVRSADAGCVPVSVRDAVRFEAPNGLGSWPPDGLELFSGDDVMLFEDCCGGAGPLAEVVGPIRLTLVDSPRDPLAPVPESPLQILRLEVRDPATTSGVVSIALTAGDCGDVIVETSEVPVVAAQSPGETAAALTDALIEALDESGCSACSVSLRTSEDEGLVVVRCRATEERRLCGSFELQIAPIGRTLSSADFEHLGQRYRTEREKLASAPLPPWIDGTTKLALTLDVPELTDGPVSIELDGESIVDIDGTGPDSDCDGVPDDDDSCPEDFDPDPTDEDGDGIGDVCDPEVTPPAMSLIGDCNGDARLDIADALCLLGHLFRGRPPALRCGDGTGSDPANLVLLDWNGDDRLDISDAIAELTWLFLGGPGHVSGAGCVPLAACPDACQ